MIETFFRIYKFKNEEYLGATEENLCFLLCNTSFRFSRQILKNEKIFEKPIAFHR